MKKDITQLDDIKLLVNTFYDKVREDDLLKDIFNEVIQDKWSIHLEKMYRFWETVLLENHTYYGGPFAPHAKLPVTKEHFDRWKLLFFQTLNDNFEEKKLMKQNGVLKKWPKCFYIKLNI